ncbi:MAG: T9SS type A sorting domain-containing protein [Crocinitomicaceae bacterium]
MKHSILVVFLLLFSTLAFSQNYVHNPSFEDIDGCPTSINDYVKLSSVTVTNWSNPTTSTPDYTNSCLGAPAATKVASFPPHSGNAYARFYPHTRWLPSPDGYYEYVQGELCHILEPGREYVLSFWAKMDDTERYGTSGLAINVSSSPLNFTGESGDPITLTPSQMTTTVYNPTSNIIGDTWTLVSGTITANGGEKYVTIGTFTSGPRAYVELDSSLPGNSLYLFVDDVSVTEADPACFPSVWIEDKVYSSNEDELAGYHIYSGKDVGLPDSDGDVKLVNGSQVDYIAGETISLEPGFSTEFNGLNDFFVAQIIPNHCNSATPPYANAGEDIYIEDCKPFPFPAIGLDCSGLSYEWSAEPAFALDWLINPNSCIAYVNVPAWAWTSGITSVTYTLKVGTCVENYTQVTVHLIDCKSLNSPTIVQEQSPTQYSVYPNPNNGNFTVQSSNEEDLSTSYTITSILGEKIESGSFKNTKDFSIDSYSKGIYLIKLVNGKNEQIEKIVVK